MGEGVYFLPSTKFEKIFYIIFILFTCIAVAFIINTMGNILDTIQREN